MGGYQNYGPFLGTLNIRCRIIIRIQKGAIILTTTHMGLRVPTLVVPVSTSLKVKYTVGFVETSVPLAA